MKEVEVGDEYVGKVVKTTTFGAFVELTQGDVERPAAHLKRLALASVWRALGDVLNRGGDEINVRVVEVDRERGRIGLRLAHDPEIAGKAVEEFAGVSRRRWRGRRQGPRATVAAPIGVNGREGGGSGGGRSGGPRRDGERGSGRPRHGSGTRSLSAGGRERRFDRTVTAVTAVSAAANPGTWPRTAVDEGCNLSTAVPRLTPACASSPSGCRERSRSVALGFLDRHGLRDGVRRANGGMSHLLEHIAGVSRHRPLWLRRRSTRSSMGWVRSSTPGPTVKAPRSSRG